ncbi:hypothetical protein PENTCL1PPCAC_9974, partial [Pristionchus entomophagus]
SEHPTKWIADISEVPAFIEKNEREMESAKEASNEADKTSHEKANTGCEKVGNAIYSAAKSAKAGVCRVVAAISVRAHSACRKTKERPGKTH